MRPGSRGSDGHTCRWPSTPGAGWPAGLHIAARYATLALVDLRGRVIARERLDHSGPNPEHVLRRIAARLPGFVDEHSGGCSPLGLGVASGGWVDRGHGVIMENAPLGWHDVPVRELMATATGLPVHVDSHSTAPTRRLRAGEE